MTTAPAAAAHPSAPPFPAPDWAQVLASTIRAEIDQGRLIRVSLPGAAGPVLVEDALIHGPLLVLVDSMGVRYFVASPVQVVVISDQLGPKRPEALQRDT